LTATEPTEYGRVLATFRFDPASGISDHIPQGRERRAWQREIPRETCAQISWGPEAAANSVDAELRDISGGGAAVRTRRRPPTNEPLWLWVGREDEKAGPVECRMLACDPEDEGMFTLRLSFIGLCPMAVFAAAMGLDN
jgi:hypothetical protein